MRELTNHDIEAELLPARELMGCAPRSGYPTTFSYTSIYNQGSGDGNGNLGLINVANGSFDGNNVYVGL